VDVPCAALLQQKVALLCHASTWQIAAQTHTVPMPAQGTDQCLDLDTLEHVLVAVALVGNDDIKIVEGLTKKAGQHNGKTRLAVIAGNQDINESHSHIRAE
jgi:hypothetical protein